MFLKDKYFKVESSSVSGQEATFGVSLLADCDVYRGHFPGKPVSPGVCNVEMVRECFEIATGEVWHLTTVDRCRFTAVASPTVCPRLCIEMSWTGDGESRQLLAVVKDERQQYMVFKGKFEK